MTPVDSPHVLLTRAAAKVLASAGEALGGPWHCYDDDGLTSVSTAETFAQAVATDCAENGPWIALMSPALAVHIVDWLQHAAFVYELGGEGDASSQDVFALRFARTVLGMEAETP